MKKFSSYLLVFVLILSNINCSKEDDFVPNENLTGNWFDAFDVNEPDVTYRVEYTFEDNGTYEYAFKAMERESGNLLGYNRYGQGTYSTENNTLLFERSKVYFLDSNVIDYTDLNILLSGKSEELEGYAVNLEFEDNGTKMVFIYLECNDVVGDCAGSREYTRM